MSSTLENGLSSSAPKVKPWHREPIDLLAINIVSWRQAYAVGPHKRTKGKVKS